MKRHETPRSLGIPISDEVFLQPWFVPKNVYSAIRRLLPSVHLSKMRYYFDDYGCLRCGQRNGMYGSNGLCERCTCLVRFRVVQALRKRLKQVGVTSDSPDAVEIEDRTETAKRLLRKFNSAPAAYYPKKWAHSPFG